MQLVPMKSVLEIYGRLKRTRVLQHSYLSLVNMITILLNAITFDEYTISYFKIMDY